jgi:hypothetical protein
MMINNVNENSLFVIAVRISWAIPSEIQIIYSLHFNGIDLYRTEDQVTVDDRVIFLKNNKIERKKLRNEINKNKHW